MGMVVDCGFWYNVAKEVLKDNPNDEEAKKILQKPAYKVGDKAFNTKAELMSYLNTVRDDLYVFDTYYRFE